MKWTKWLTVCAFLLLYGTIVVFRHDINRAVVVSTASLDGLVVVIDPGHGGADPGAVRDGVNEEDINFAVSMKTRDFLEAMGATVIMTRTTDRDLASPDAEKRKREDLENRSQIMNQPQVSVFVSIHANVDSSPKSKGSYVFYRIGDETSKEFAACLQGSLQELTKDTHVEKEGDYYILNHTSTIGAIVEIGFLTNEQERVLLQQDAYQEKLAYQISKGILDYWNHNGKSGV